MIDTAAACAEGRCNRLTGAVMRVLRSALACALFACATAAAFERTETREPCADHDPLRRPLFGDLHVHTRLSFDSMISSQRNGPDEA